jgi:photosystem II stability/assembly factor-like uncharacterized protein
VRSLAIDPGNPQILYTGTASGGVFKSTNGGSSWTVSSGGLSNDEVTCLAIDPVNSQTIFAGTWGNGVWKSSDGGSNWASTEPTNMWVYCLAVDPTYSQILYVGTRYGEVGGVWKSTNGGTSWTASATGLTNSNILSLAIDPGNSQVVYAGACDLVFKSTSDETASSTGLTNSHVVGMNIGVGVVCKSSDGRASWAAFSSGLPNSPVSVAIDSSGILYTVTANGVFRMTPE